MISTADFSCSYIQEEMVEPLSDEVFVSNSTFVEATNFPITDEATVVREYFCVCVYVSLLII